MRFLLLFLLLFPSRLIGQESNLPSITGQLGKIGKSYVLYECKDGKAAKYPQYLDFEYKDWKPPQTPAVLVLAGVKLNKVHRDEIFVKSVTNTFANSTCDKILDPADYYLDFFTGSIEIQDNELILRRCDVVENKYILRPSSRAKANFVKTLKKRKLNPKNITTLIAHYVEINGNHALEVFKIYKIEANKTCHLSDILK